jgi:hypothetical protein
MSAQMWMKFLGHPRRKVNVVFANLIPKFRGSPIVANVERIFQRTTDFIRGNPIVSTASVGAGVTGLIATAAIIKGLRRKKKAKKKGKRRVKKSVKRRGKKKTKAQIKAMRLRNLVKARRARRKGGRRKRKIIRGRGLGTREIRHSGKSTKGKFKLVSFRDKRTGKMVRFKARK